MTLFYIGLVLFLGPHFFSAIRSRAEGQDIRVELGEAKYMGLYSLVSLLGFALLIWGYAKASPGPVIFEGPHDLHHIAWIPMMVALILLTAAYTPLGYIKRFVQHPMMLAVLIWSLTHLAMGGDLKRLLLFGGFALYSLTSLIFAYRRGTDLKSKTPGLTGDILAIIIGIGLAGILMHGAHLYLFKAYPL